MAKINVELDLDFINEDYTLSETMQQELKVDIRNNIIKKIDEKVVSDLTKIQKEEVEKTVSKEVLNFIKNFMKKKIVITNRWGEKVEETSIENKIKTELTDFSTSKVDDSGCLDSRGRYSYFEYITKNIIQKQLKEFEVTIKKDNDAIVSEAIENLKKNNDEFILKKLAEKILADTSLTNFIAK